MSINIGSKIAAVSDIKMTIHLDRLTKRERANVESQVRRGVVGASSVTSQIARHILDANNLPYVELRHYGYVNLHNVPLDPSHPLREALMVAEAAAKMVDADMYVRTNGRHLSLEETKTGWWNFRQSYIRNSAFKNVTCNNDVSIPSTIELDLKSK